MVAANTLSTGPVTHRPGAGSLPLGAPWRSLAPPGAALAPLVPPSRPWW
jgi:hypothetical protein